MTSSSSSSRSTTVSKQSAGCVEPESQLAWRVVVVQRRNDLLGDADHPPNGIVLTLLLQFVSLIMSVSPTPQ
jgi:hypothetical protein